MLCYQCEQTARGTGCTVAGVCGKTPETSDLQDLLVYVCKAVSSYAHRARLLGAKDAAIDKYIIEALFTTVTNVNFDPARVEKFILTGKEMLDKARALYQQTSQVQGKTPAPFPALDNWKFPATRAAMTAEAAAIGIAKRLETLGPDIAGLQELIIYGLKGTAAYLDHAIILGVSDDTVLAFFHEALDFFSTPAVKDINALTALALKVGEVNLRVMELLDQANTAAYGHPEPTVVRVTPIPGKAILVSGHDLRDLDLLCQQTEGKGINIYTHGEMLPCLAYPGLKKYKHLAGNYGGAWQDQHKEFASFPGAILMTTNCIQKPADSYKSRIFTTGLVAWPDVTHIGDNKDFTPVIKAALAQPGFTTTVPEKTITIGFGHNTVMSVAGQVIDGVKAGKIKHFFLIGGCDGAKSGRNYYTELAQAVPADCVIMTLACGKYRFNKLDFGAIDGIPRLLDIGQCNDAYSAIQIAVALAGAFNCGVNDLPLSIVLSWYEQKAVCILLTLLHLGIKNMRIGPTLPAFIGPNVLQVLVKNFGLTPIGNAQDDLKTMLKVS